MAHFEVVEIAPPLGVLEALLAACAYGERNEAAGPGGAQAGVTWGELTQRVQCSEKELSAALRRLRAVELNGRWTTVEPGAARASAAQLPLSHRHRFADNAARYSRPFGLPTQPTCTVC